MAAREGEGKDEAWTGRTHAAQGVKGNPRIGLAALRSVHIARRGQHKEAARLDDQMDQLAPRTQYIYVAARCHALLRSRGRKCQRRPEQQVVP
jgi:hypothetical protein